MPARSPPLLRIMKESARFVFSAIRCLRKKRPLASHAVGFESPPLPPNVNVELHSGDLSACEINARFCSGDPPRAWSTLKSGGAGEKGKVKLSDRSGRFFRRHRNRFLPCSMCRWRTVSGRQLCLALQARSAYS